MSDAGQKVVAEPVNSALYDFVRSALTTQRVEVSELTEHYLVALLGGFVRSDPQVLSDALGPELLRAVSLDPVSRYSTLKRVADTALFLSGIFLDHVEASLAATDYFFGIGSRAYLDLGALDEQTISRGDSYAETYRDLGCRFEEFVGVLAYISDKQLFGSNESAVRIYRRWMASGNQRDASRLLELGLIPSLGDTSKVH